MNIYRFVFFASLLYLSTENSTLYAQALYKGSGIVPSSPTSADAITYVRWEPNRGCARFSPPHKVSMVGNNITISFAKWDDTMGIGTPPPDDGNRFVDSVDLGRLPEGDYTLSTVNAPCAVSLFGPPGFSPPDVDRLPFKVALARPRKSIVPSQIYPNLDFTGQWSDENDPGWALFVSQDSADNLLVSWNSYMPDGSPIWYVAQPRWSGAAITFTSDIWQTSKPPTTGSIPTGATKLTKIGTTNLSFYFGERNQGAGSPIVEQYASFVYTLGTAPFVRRTLTRFKAR